MTNRLYYGDNLDILQNEIADESVDLIYLDPPFNSNATYNVLFKAPTGEQSQAQIEAFEDTWHWTTDGAEESLLAGLAREKLRSGADAGSHARLPRRERYDGLSRHDVGTAD